jgi:hypothetical protein
MRITAYRNNRRKQPGEANKLELEFAELLERQKKQGLIHDYAYEPESLKLADKTRYTPDFRVIQYYTTPPDESYARIVFYEVKGTTTKKKVKLDKEGNEIVTKTKAPYIESASNIKIKLAAELHPYKFIVAWKEKDGWHFKEVN